MRRPPASVRPHRPILASLAMAFVLLVPAAHAGLGDLVKSAKDKAVKAAAPKQAGKGGQAIPFDDTMLELTGELLDRLIACRKQANAATGGRAAAVARREAVTREINELSGKHGGAISDNSNKRYEVGNCMESELQEAKSRRMEAEQQRLMANPAAAEKVAKLAVALNEAQLKGDTAAVARLSREAEALYAPTPADTLAARKKCGAMPALHPAKVKIDALEQELAGLDAKIREFDRKAMELQVEKCKLTEKQIAMAWERIELYLQKSRHSDEPSGFSGAELQALPERKKELEAAFAG